MANQSEHQNSLFVFLLHVGNSSPMHLNTRCEEYIT
jgi:hypothetical protein